MSATEPPLQPAIGQRPYARAIEDPMHSSVVPAGSAVMNLLLGDDTSSLLLGDGISTLTLG